MTKQPHVIAVRIMFVSVLLFLSFGLVQGQSDVTIKNTSREIKPGLYECIIYLELDEGVVGNIDDVTYTLPPGYPKRKVKVRKAGTGGAGFFSSGPITTTEEAVVNVKIDYKGKNDVFLSYKLKIFTATLK